VSPLPNITPLKPGSATLPFYGIKLALLDPHTGEELKGNGVSGVLTVKHPWPSMARTVYGDHDRYLSTYFRPYKGYFLTGDSAERDSMGYIWIKGRMDDVINVSGHRLSTAEIEGAIIQHKDCGEVAVIGHVDDLTG
jgi:acetyl-CoA synthetase